MREQVLADGTRQWTYPDGRLTRRAAGSWDVQSFRPPIRDGLTPAEIDRVLPPSLRPSDWADRSAARAAIARHHEQGFVVQCNRIIMPVTGTSGATLTSRDGVWSWRRSRRCSAP